MRYETAVARMKDWKICDRCGKKFFRKDYQTPGLWRKQRFCSRICGRPVRRPVTKSAFLKKVNKNPETGCWIWAGRIDHKGYGVLWNNGKHVKAHRLSWEFHNGAIPDKMSVCHHCDTPPCVNPDHLFIGLQADNVRDMDSKGRRGAAKGSKHGRSILTEDQVLLVFKDRRSDMLIAAELGVSKSTINAIRSGQNWGHATNAAKP